MEAISDLGREISSLHVTAPLALFCLYAGGLNEDLCERAHALKQRISTHLLDDNRSRNKRWDSVDPRGLWSLSGPETPVVTPVVTLLTL